MDNKSMLISHLWPQNNHIRMRVVTSLSCLILAKIMSMLVPLAYKSIVNDLSDHSEYMLVLWVIIAYGIARIMSQVFNELRDIIFARVGCQAVRTLSLQVFKHLHSLSLRFHIMRKTGGLSRTIERGTKGIESLLRFSLYNIIPTCFEIVLVCSVLWYNYGASFACAAFITLLLYILFTLWISEWRVSFVKQMNLADSEASAKAVDSLINFETVKYFGNEEFEAKRFDASLFHYQESAIKNSVGLSLLNIGQIIIITTGLVVSMLMAQRGIQQGLMTVGDFVLINAYILQISIPLYIIGFTYREIKDALMNISAMFRLLDVKEEVPDAANATNLEIQHSGRIAFENVSFAYEEARQILKNISFTVESGKTTAVVGSTGSGKSTIAKLLFRFYDVTSGRITIDNSDIRDITQQSLRSLIGVVPQDTVLFNDTIYYNILYGNVNALEQDIVRVARLANVHDFIMSLPDGYNTIVGERGLKLSGGEKQRIAIARTYLKNPKIYIFDEATSALDTSTEKLIQTNLNELSSTHTTIIIAHRLSTIVHADQIIVLESGKIIERGTHEELIALKSRYYELWTKQQEEVV